MLLEAVHFKVLCQQRHTPCSIYLWIGNASYEWRGGKGACCVLGRGEAKEKKLLHRGQNFDPIDV